MNKTLHAAWWLTILSTAALIGCAITSTVSWWTILLPITMFIVLWVLLLVSVFIIAFTTTFLIGYIELRKATKEYAEEENERRSRSSRS